jgi:hypothetical protein
LERNGKKKRYENIWMRKINKNKEDKIINYPQKLFLFFFSISDNTKQCK